MSRIEGWTVTSDEDGGIAFRISDPRDKAVIKRCIFLGVRCVASKETIRFYPDPEKQGPGVTYESWQEDGHE
jgi:hypothetical protein